MKIRIFVSTIFAFVLAASSAAQITDPAMLEMTKPHDSFRIVGNVYYVGANDVTSYLITSKAGHILIDSGFEETVPIIEEGVRKLGFDLKDVKIILNNHAHFDHCGGLKMLKDKTGAKIYSVKEQADLLASGGRTDFRFGGEQLFEPVSADRILKDGEVVSLGGNELTTILTPGHTKGATTWTMKVRDGGKEMTVIFLSSTSTLDYDLVSNGNFPGIADAFETTFRRLQGLSPDVFLGSHAGFFSMERKFRMMKDGASRNPFIDPEGYRDFVARMHREFSEKLAGQKASGGKQNKE